MSVLQLLRHPLELLPALGGAALMLLVLGPNLRGAAGAALAAVGALVVRVRSGAAPSAPARPLRVLDRLQLGPRVTLVLVETSGRRYLVSGGAAVTPLPPQEP